jgi:hypothetical protein
MNLSFFAPTKLY